MTTNYSGLNYFVYEGSWFDGGRVKWTSFDFTDTALLLTPSPNENGIRNEGIGYDTESLSSLTNGFATSNSKYLTVLATGYFFAPISGEYRFLVNGYHNYTNIWIGDNNVLNYATMGQIINTQYFPSNTVNLNKGVYYPIRILISTGYWNTNTFNFSITDPNNITSYGANNYFIQIPPVVPVPCFKKGSKILTDKGYVAVELLKKGDLIKTLKHDYKSIVLIGKKDIHHPCIEDRIKEQLYVCNNANYSEIIEDLILTGCHSILVDRFKTNEEKEFTIRVNGDTYITDNKYRLPACVDSRAIVYDTPGTYTIYHFALDNSDDYMNYGVYANGLLVETSNKKYMSELSNLELY